MSKGVDVVYKPLKGGLLGPLAKKRRQKLDRVRAMAEDRDAVTDLSQEPDLTDFPTHAWQFFGANRCAEEMSKAELEDVSDDEQSDMPRQNAKEKFGNVANLDFGWVEDRYRKQFPKLWQGKQKRGKKECTMEHAAEEYIKTPAHGDSSGFGSGEKYKIVVHKDFDWDRGRRGHDDTGKHKKSFAGRKQRYGRKRCARIVNDHIEANWLWANYWNPSFANFHGDMEFDKRADEARYYAALMSHISPELRADWADHDPWNWEALLEFEFFYKEFEAYERGDYLRSPEAPSPQGWWFMDLPPRERLLFEEREWEESVECLPKVA